jgi:hypothetical protein
MRWQVIIVETVLISSGSVPVEIDHHAAAAGEMPGDRERAPRGGAKFSNDFDRAVEPAFAGETVESVTADDKIVTAGEENGIPETDADVMIT